MSGGKKTESFKSLVAAIEANDQAEIVNAATRVARERIKAKPGKTRCKTR
jgi:hypothetical protein